MTEAEYQRAMRRIQKRRDDWLESYRDARDALRFRVLSEASNLRSAADVLGVTVRTAANMASQLREKGFPLPWKGDR